VSSLGMLQASLLDLPLPSDSLLQIRDTVSTGPPVLMPAYFPQSPPQSYYNAALFKRLEPDTLFWIFYYQQGTPQQLYAAQELKKSFWRCGKLVFCFAKVLMRLSGTIRVSRCGSSDTHANYPLKLPRNGRKGLMCSLMRKRDGVTRPSLISCSSMCIWNRNSGGATICTNIWFDNKQEKYYYYFTFNSEYFSRALLVLDRTKIGIEKAKIDRAQYPYTGKIEGNWCSKRC
jgi:hypothetical protein